MSEVFDEKATEEYAREFGYRMGLNAFIEGARWQHSQDKAVIEGKDKEIQRLKKQLEAVGFGG